MARNNKEDRNEDKREPKPPAFIAYSVTERGKDSFWTRIGAAWDHDDGKGFSIDVELAVKVPDLDRAAAEALVQKAHVVCPYSHAIKSTIDVRLRVV